MFVRQFEDLLFQLGHLKCEYSHHPHGLADTFDDVLLIIDRTSTGNGQMITTEPNIDRHLYPVW